jgi:hypothetical protein
LVRVKVMDAKTPRETGAFFLTASYISLVIPGWSGGPDPE